jgi:uncharacterized protein YcfJ
MVTALNLGLGAVLAVGLSACNRDASADNGLTATDTPAQAAQARAARSDAAPAPKYGRVVSVDPIREQAGPPRQVCHDEVVSHRAPVKDQHQIAGTAIGAIAGGLLGNQVGGGKGKTLATVAGAVGGGYAGHEVQQNRQENNVTSSVRRRCTTVKDTASDKVVAYDVRYEYNGVTRSVRMDHDPGDRVEVQEGVVSVSDAR